MDAITRTTDPQAVNGAEATPSSAAPVRSTSIVVNGVRHVVEGDRIDYEEVVRLADERAVRIHGHTVAFTRGPAGAPEGLLTPGHGTVIVEDQVFHAAVTQEG